MVELGASMKVASTMEPPRIMTPAASSSEFSSSSMALPRPFLSRMWRNFASVVASGTCSRMRSMCMNLCMARESRMASSVPSSERPNMTWSRYILSIVSAPRTCLPRCWEW